MVNPIPEGVREAWDEWKFKGSVLLSLCIQIILVLVAPFRKRTSHMLVRATVWTLYVLADGVALFALGQVSDITNKCQGSSGSPSSSTKNSNDGTGDLQVMWSAFLLVHLGGPDTITAFSIADTQLWFRLFVSMLVQAAATLYLILLTLPCNKVIAPTMLLFIVGIVKYAERCVSLYLACSREIVEWESITHASRWKREFCTWEIERINTILGGNNIDEQEIVMQAYCLKERARPLYFAHVTDSARILEVSMNMIYEKVYSKALVLHCRWGYALRFLTLCSTAAALCIFRFRDQHHCCSGSIGGGNDVGITYVLLGGAITLELYSIAMLIFSDWTLARFECCNNLLLRKLVQLKMPKWDDDNGRGGTRANILFRRWSSHVSCYNVTRRYFCSGAIHKDEKKKPKSFSSSLYNNSVVRSVGKMMLQDKFFKAEYEEWKYVSHEPLTKILWIFIFTCLGRESSEEERFKFYSGGGLLKAYTDDPYIDLLNEDHNFGRSLVIWSIATDILYHNGIDSASSDNYPIDGKYCSKILSDYMLYLFVIRRVWPQLGDFDGRFRNLCVRMYELGEEHGGDPEAKAGVNLLLAGQPDDHREIYIQNLENRELLDCAAKLAKILMEASTGSIQGGWEQMWLVVGQIWVEKLLLGAIKCSANTHIELLSRGGELLTLVWLFSAGAQSVFPQERRI